MSKSQTSLTILFNKYRHYLPAVLGLGLAGVVLIICVNWIFSIVTTYEEIDQANTQIDDLQVRINRLDSLRSGELDDIRDIVDTSLPKEKPVFETLAAVTSVARETNTLVSNLQSRPGSVATGSGRVIVNPSVNTTKKARKFETITVNLEIQGTFSNIKSFFEELLNVAPLMELKTVRLSSSRVDEAEDEPIFSSELELEVYWKPELLSSGNLNIQDSKIEQLSTEQIELLDKIDTLRRFGDEE